MRPNDRMPDEPLRNCRVAARSSHILYHLWSLVYQQPSPVSPPISQVLNNCLAPTFAHHAANASATKKSQGPYARDGHGENLQRDLWSLSLKSHSATFTPWRYIVDFLKEERDRLRAQGQEIIALPADAVAIALQEEKQRVDQATADFKQYLADLKEQRLASQKSA